MDRISSRYIRAGIVAALLASLTVLVLVPSIRKDPKTTFVKTPSGRRVPHSILHSRLHFIPEHQYETHVFELTEEGRRLRGHRFSDRFHVDADNSLHKDLDPLASYLHNGRRITTSTGGSRLLSVSNGKYSASVDATGTVLAIWGKGLSLTPLHIDEYPSIFLHTPDKAKEIQDDVMQSSTYSRKVVSYSTPKIRQLDNTTCTPDSQPRVYTIVVAFGNSFCATYGNDADRAISAVKAGIALAGEIYSYQTCIILRVTDSDAHCNDPNDPYQHYSSSMTYSQIHGSFDAYWQNTLHAKTIGDQAQFITPFADSSGALGVAFISSACKENGHFWTYNIPFTTIAHEIGHTLSAQHTPGSGHLMDWGWYRFGYLTFAPTALAKVQSYVTASTGNCLVSSDKALAARPGMAATATCATLLPPNSLLGCGENYTIISGVMDVVIDQWGALVYVALFPSKGSKIVKAQTFVGLDMITNDFNLPPSTVDAAGQDRVDYTYYLDKIPTTQNSGSCCGSSLYVSAKAKVCKGPDFATDCKDQMVNAPYKIVCEDPCKGGTGNRKYEKFCPACAV